MASATLSNHRFPNGTVVKAYPLTNWPNAIPVTDAAAPGTEAASATVTSDSFTFTGLNASQTYLAYALVGGQHVYVSFVAAADVNPISPGSGIIVDDDTSLTADSSTRVPTQHAVKTAISAGGAGAVPDASATVKGVTKLATAPASATNPIAVGDNDPRNTNARTPTAHTHPESDVTGLVADLATKPTATLDTDATLAANSDTRVASQKAAKGYVDTATGLLIPKSLVDAKGDLLVGTANDTVARKAAGTNERVLIADSAQADGMRWGIPSLPGCRVFNSVNISHATSGTIQTLTFDSERFDTDSIHSTVSNTDRLTCVTAGVYLITGHVNFAASATGFRALYIDINNAATYLAIQIAPASPTLGTTLSVTTLFKLAVNDYVQLKANQTSGGALNMQALGDYSIEFGMHLIGAG